MKNRIKISVQMLTASFMMAFGTADAQLTVMSTGSNYNVGGVSDNGVVSMHISGDGTIFKWTADGGLVQIGALSGGSMIAGNTLVTSNGNMISSAFTNPATGFPEISTYNLATSSWTNRGALSPTSPGGGESTPYGMSPDGNTIVGLSFLDSASVHAVKWTPSSGMVDLGSIVPGRDSRANGVSADGNVIVGWQDEETGIRRGVKWVDGTESFITDNTGSYVDEAQGVSADGSTIIGGGGGNPTPYIWNAATGLTYITHPNASTFFRGGTTGISADGKTVIGYYRPLGGPPMAGEGFIWTPTGGRVKLNDYVASLGIATNGITLGLPQAISRDGKKIAGMGVDANFQFVAFYLDLTSYLSVNDAVKDKNSIVIYPNPVADVLYFKGTDRIEKAEIYNMVGQKIKSFGFIEGKIDVSSLSKGDYILQYSVKGRNPESYKFVKK